MKNKKQEYALLGSLRIRFQHWKDSRKQAVDAGLLQQAQVELLTESTPDLTIVRTVF